MLLNDGPDDGKPKPHALVRLPGREERGEDVRQLVFPDSHARVFDETVTAILVPTHVSERRWTQKLFSYKEISR